MKTSNTNRIEKSILGTLILTPTKYYEINTILEPRMFSGKLSIVAELFWFKMGEDNTVDSNILAFECGKQGIDQSSVLGLINYSSGSTLIAQAKALKDAYLIAQEILLHEKSLVKLRQGEKLEEVLSNETAEREILIGSNEDENQSRTKKVTNFLERVHQARKQRKEGKLIGIPTGLPGVDEITGGWQITNYIIQAARPGMGKTTGALESLLAAVEAGFPALFISLEMSYNEVLAKLVQKKSGVSRIDMQRGLVTDQDLDKITAAASELFELPFFIETGCYELHQIKDKIRMYSRKYGVKLVIIDYLQLVTMTTDKKTSRNYEIETISRSLKQVASESDSNLALIALSQLNRGVESRGGAKRPMMSDLRDSGSLEQDADLIAFWYRPDYYGIMEDDGQSTKGLVEMIWTKNRHNAEGLKICKMGFNIKTDSYRSWSEEFEQPKEPSTVSNYNNSITPVELNGEEIPF